MCALPLRVLIEEQHAKIEPAIKKFQQECSGHTDSQACKEEHDALVKALNGFLSLVQNGFKVIDAHANDASDADYQKQMEALRARAQQHLDWGASSSQRCNEEGIESHCTVRRKRLRTTTEIVGFVKYWEIIGDNLSKAGWSWGCVSAIDSNGRTIWICFHLDQLGASDFYLYINAPRA